MSELTAVEKQQAKEPNEALVKAIGTAGDFSLLETGKQKAIIG